MVCQGEVRVAMVWQVVEGGGATDGGGLPLVEDLLVSKSLTIQFFNASNLQHFNSSTLQFFNISILQHNSSENK